MRILKFMAPLALALVLCAASQAAEKDPNKFTGTLAAKPADVKDATVVATLSVKKPEPKTYNLSADGDVAKQITDLLAKNAKASVTGTATGDTIKVTAVEEAKKKPK